MRQQSYLVRKGARYHFRRRVASDYKSSPPITVPLNTAEPDQARRLARKLAVRWDDVAMNMDAMGRATLTRDEQRALFRKGLEDELTTATRHLTAPLSSLQPHPQTVKILAAAYEVIRRVPPCTAMIGPEQVEQVVGDGWSNAPLGNAQTLCIAAFASVPAVWVLGSAGWRGGQHALLLVDLVTLAAFVWIALSSSRFWPLSVAGFHLDAVLTHVAKLLAPSAVPAGYALLQGFWTYPLMGALAVGTYRTTRRKRDEHVGG